MARHRRRSWLFLGCLLFVAASLAGCGTAKDDGESDVFADGSAAVCPLSPAPADFAYPAGPYGTAVGDVFEDFTLENCGGEQVRFRDILASSELVLFNVGAGWCEPCIEETTSLEATVNQPLCERGLRVVQVIFQDDQSRPATKLFCDQWTREFGLTFPVLVDPLFTTSTYFEAANTPLNLLVDRDGVIRFRSTGTVAADLPQRIDALLSE